MAQMVRHWTFQNLPDKWAEVDKEVNEVVAQGWDIIDTTTNIVGESINAQVVYEVKFNKVQGARYDD